MKNCLILLLLVRTGVSFAQPIHETIDSYMQAANHARLFNGMVLVSHHDSIILQKGYGWRDLTSKTPPDSLSQFQIGSLTKSFTSTLILQLQEKGLLRLNDTLGKYFPFYRIGSGVTIEQLLAHTGGIYEYSRDPVFMESIYSGHFSQQDFWNMVKDQPLDFPPGSQYRYSNCGYLILGYLAEKVTGKPYWQLVREGIFSKAGMQHSGFDFAMARKPYKTTGYERMYSTPVEPARIVDSSYSYSAGAIYSTVSDLYRFGAALMGGRLISDTSLKKAFTPVLAHYGYGWATQQMLNKQVIMHEGAIPGFLTLMALLPEDHYSVILLDNNRDPGTDLRRCFADLFKILYHQPYVLPRLAIQLPPGSLTSYIGDYELVDNPNFKGHIKLDNGRLTIAWNTDKPEELFAEKKDFFFINTYDLQLEFSRDSTGKINGFNAFSGGKKFVYRRIG